MKKEIEQDDLLTEQDPLGNLLGHSPLPAPDAWFTARTVVRCRHEMAATRFRTPSYRMLIQWAVAGALACSLMVLVGIHQHRAEKHHQKAVQEAFDVIATWQNNSDPTWQDTTL